MIRRPRQHSEKHLDFIRSLPCCVCPSDIGIETEAAHIRFACEEVGKRKVGIGEKPDDIWTVPLCSRHHRDQHDQGELVFWRYWKRDPIRIALALWANTGVYEVGSRIARTA